MGSTREAEENIIPRLSGEIGPRRKAMGMESVREAEESAIKQRETIPSVSCV